MKECILPMGTLLYFSEIGFERLVTEEGNWEQLGSIATCLFLWGFMNFLILMGSLPTSWPFKGIAIELSFLPSPMAQVYQWG